MEPADANSLLTVNNLNIHIGQPPVHAVKGINFQIRPGEILGLAGESGSGKSVTAHSLARLLPSGASPKYEGSVQLDGIQGNLLQLSAGRVRSIRGTRIAYVFQEPSASFNPLYTISYQMDEILRLSKRASNDGSKPDREERRQQIREAMEQVGVAATQENLRAYPGAFSGGMLQRMAVAGAIAQNPDLLVADEPTTALDTSTQKRIVELLQRLNRDKGMAILFISHNLALLKQLADRVLIMQEGKIVEEGPIVEVLNHPQHPYTRGLVESIPKLELPAGTS
jgi:ABC-type dipeptide/oligopeptide/nickel transport system ATPase component